MRCTALSNYEITRNQMRGEFIKYDQENMIRKFQLKHDEAYLYIPFTDRDYRINRKDGVVEWTQDGFVTTVLADYDDTMTIYDVLCYSKPGCKLSGKFCSIALLKGTTQFSNGGIELGRGYAKKFTGKTEKLSKACEAFGEKADLKGDLAYILHPFSFLPVVLQFWDADEEFPANLKFMFDENIMDYMHYETIYYMVGHILNRLEQLIEEM
ncbi:MAG: DUF3786 domain-containing protein [Muricoprocola sp.]